MIVAEVDKKLIFHRIHFDIIIKGLNEKLTSVLPKAIETASVRSVFKGKFSGQKS